MSDSISFLRVIKTGFLNFWRNLWLSTGATMVMTITLVIFSVLFLLFALANISLKSVKDTVDISAYFKLGTSEEQVLAAQQDLQSDSRVKEVTYISAQQGFLDFKNRHLNEDSIIASLNELDANPIPPTLHIKANNLEDYPAIADKLQSGDFKNQIDKVNFQDNQVIIERLSKILRFIETGGLVLALFFALIAVLVVYNTLTLTFYNRREEIEIMRLVGATNWYIRGPFLIETLLYSVFSTIFTAILLVPIFSIVIGSILRYLFPGLVINNILVPGVSFQYGRLFNFWFLILILFGISVVISVISTFLAMRKYLKI